MGGGGRAPLRKILSSCTLTKAGHSRGLQHSPALQLIDDQSLVNNIGGTLRIGLDAPNEVWGGGVDDVHEGAQLGPELGSYSVSHAQGTGRLGSGTPACPSARPCNTCSGVKAPRTGRANSAEGHGYWECCCWHPCSHLC